MDINGEQTEQTAEPTRRVSRSKNRRLWAQDLESRILWLWQDARRDSLTFDAILTRYRAILDNSRTYPLLSQNERARVQHTFSVCMAVNGMRDIVWRLGPESGPLPEDGQVWAEGSELSRLCRIPGALYGSHFWRGTDKPFGEWKPTN